MSRKTIVIAVREFQAATRTKTFFISLVIMPIFMFGSIAVQMLLHDKGLVPWVGEHPVWAKPASIALAVLVTVLGWWFARKAARSPHLVEEP